MAARLVQKQALRWFDVKDAFLQVLQEKLLKVILRGELVKRNPPGQVGAKAWFDIFHTARHRGTQL